MNRLCQNYIYIYLYIYVCIYADLNYSYAQAWRKWDFSLTTDQWNLEVRTATRIQHSITNTGHSDVRWIRNTNGGLGVRRTPIALLASAACTLKLCEMCIITQMRCHVHGRLRCQPRHGSVDGHSHGRPCVSQACAL